VSAPSQPVSSRPLTAVQEPGAQAAAPAADGPTPAPSQPLTKQQMKAIEQAREEERKAYLAQQKKDAEAKKAEDKRKAEEARKTEELRKQVEKLEQDRMKRESEEKKNTTDRQNPQDETAARLKELQDLYLQEASSQAPKEVSSPATKTGSR
jgi:colicin import membrane protein